MHGRPEEFDRRSLPQALLWFGVLMGLILLVAGAGFVGPAVAVADSGVLSVRDYGAKGDGLTDDSVAFLACIAATPTGGVMYVPAGDYKITRSLELKSGFTLRGDGPTSRVFRPSTGGPQNLLWAKGRTNLRIQDLRIDSDNSTGEFMSGIQVSGCSLLTIQRVTFDKLGYAMKIDGGWGRNSDVNVLDCEVLEAWTPLYVSYTSNSRFANLKLEAYRTPADTIPHCVYLAAGNHNQLWENITLTGGRSYSFQMYGASATNPSDNITVKNLTMTDVGQGIVVASGYSNVLFDGIVGTSTRWTWPGSVGWVDLQNGGSGNAGGHVFRNFSFTDGFLLSCNDTSAGRPGPVVFEGGYLRRLDYFAPNGIGTTSVDNVTLINVGAAPPSSGSTAHVSILSPADGSVVQGRVDVRMKITSSAAVGKVRLYVDGRLIATDYRAPYVFTWNTRSAVPGSNHTVTGVAYGASGEQTGTTALAVKVGSSSSSKLLMAAASTPAVAGFFVDLTLSSPYGEAVLALAEAGVVSGFEDGRFGADSLVTRAQVAKMVAGTLGIADGESTWTPFVDLDPVVADLYPHKYIAALFSLGAVEGTSPDRFSPWDSVSRAQLITIAVRALGTLAPEALGEPPAGFVSSMGNFSPSHEEPMRIAESNRLLEGLYGYGPAWDPWVPATRGEVAQILHNLTILE